MKLSLKTLTIVVILLICTPMIPTALGQTSRSAILTINISAPSSLIGLKITLEGRLHLEDGNEIPDARIVLGLAAPFGPYNFLTSTTTSVDGSWRVDWIPTVTGEYSVCAIWVKTSVTPMSWSRDSLNVTQTLPGMPPTEWGAVNATDIALSATEDKQLFVVVSNSTVSALAFNTTSRELSFTVSGSSGTKGYAEVTIAKSLLADATSLKIFLTETELESNQYSLHSTDDSWLLRFTFIFQSSYKVTLNLGPKPALAPEPKPGFFVPMETFYTITIIVIIMAIVAAVTVLKKRTK